MASEQAFEPARVCASKVLELILTSTPTTDKSDTAQAANSSERCQA